MKWYCYRVEQGADNDAVYQEPSAWTEVELHLCLADTDISDPANGKCVMQLPSDYDSDAFSVGLFYEALR